MNGMQLFCAILLICAAALEILDTFRTLENHYINVSLCCALILIGRDGEMFCEGQTFTALPRPLKPKPGLNGPPPAEAGLNGPPPQCFRREHIVIIPLTVREILDETIAHRLV
jgi:hypothetical protein